MLGIVPESDTSNQIALKWINSHWLERSYYWIKSDQIFLQSNRRWWILFLIKSSLYRRQININETYHLHCKLDASSATHDSFRYPNVNKLEFGIALTGYPHLTLSLNLNALHQGQDCDCTWKLANDPIYSESKPPFCTVISKLSWMHAARSGTHRSTNTLFTLSPKLQQLWSIFTHPIKTLHLSFCWLSLFLSLTCKSC